MECFLCRRHDNLNNERLENISVGYDDGTVEPVFDILHRIVGVDLFIPQASKCCTDCVFQIHNYSTTQRALEKTKSEIVSKLNPYFNEVKKSTVVGQVGKRKRVKPARLIKDESEAEEDVTNDTETLTETLIPISPLEWNRMQTDMEFRNSIFNDHLAKSIVPLYPNCSFSKLSDCTSKCLSKRCHFNVTYSISLSSKSYQVLTRGRRSTHDGDDRNRFLFELSKNEFIQESLCEFCCEKFIDDHALQRHHATVKECLYKCPVCSQVEFKTFQSRNLHFLINHVQDSPYQCSNPECNMTFKTAYRKVNHEKKCVYHINYPCDKCDKTFASLRNLSDHIKVLHSENSKENFQFTCKVCSKVFFKRSNYDSHMISHTGSNVKPFICEQCKVGFKRLRSLKFHLQTKHGSTKKSYLCSSCGKNFFSVTGYRQHIAKHSGSTYIKRKFACSQCEKAFRSRSDLQIHQVVHTKLRAFNCSASGCSSSFTQKASLQDHLNVHMKKFQCTTCHKAFGRHRYLLSHMKSNCHGTVAPQGETKAVQNEAAASGVVININEGQQTAFQEVAFMVATSAPQAEQPGQTITISQV